jgi:molybdopterin converting factor small subunit
MIVVKDSKVKAESATTLLKRNPALSSMTDAPIACGRRTSCVVREAAMQVRVRLYASLSRYYGKVAAGVPFEIDLPENAMIVDLVNRLKLPKEEVKLFFVKGRARPINWPLGPGDEVGIFPLIGGG